MLSGCASDPAKDPPISNKELVLHTTPDECDLSAAEARNRSHVHDYWNGRHGIQVVDGAFTMLCSLRRRCPGGALRARGRQCGPAGHALGQHHVQLEDVARQRVPRAAPVGGDGGRPRAVGRRSRQTVQIEVNNTQNELPHEVLSNWAFEIRMSPPAATNTHRINGEGTLLVEAARGHLIPVFPPHPDLWNGTDEILLFASRTRPSPSTTAPTAATPAGNGWARTSRTTARRCPTTWTDPATWCRCSAGTVDPPWPRAGSMSAARLSGPHTPL